MTIRFGKSQLSNPTPAHISRRIDITTAIAAGVSTWVSSASYIGPKSSSIITSLLGLVIIIAQILKPFYGVEHLPTKIPADDVTTVETKP